MIPAVADLDNARGILVKMLEPDFDEVEVYRRQLAVAELRRHETGCSIEVDRARAAPASYLGGNVVAEAFGHGKLWMMLHAVEGYLDDLELLDHARFPDPATVRVRVGR